MPCFIVLIVPEKRSRTLGEHLPGERFILYGVTGVYCGVPGDTGGYWGCIFEVLAPQGLVAPHYCGRSL